MNRSTLALAALLSLGPVHAFAQDDRGNVGQPERRVPQTGQTTGGPADTPAVPDRTPAPGVVTPAPGVAPGAGAVDSAKGGNADETNKPVPNTGGTSGGPGR